MYVPWKKRNNALDEFSSWIGISSFFFLDQGGRVFVMVMFELFFRCGCIGIGGGLGTLVGARSKKGSYDPRNFMQWIQREEKSMIMIVLESIVENADYCRDPPILVSTP